MIQVRHRSHATYSRQPRQVRKEATVTGSCVCSGSPVPGLLFERPLFCNAPRPLHILTTLCARNAPPVRLQSAGKTIERRRTNMRSFPSKLVSPSVTIRVSGSLSQGHLKYLDQLVASAIDCALWPLLDLAGLEELDRVALMYLLGGEGRDFGIVACPNFIREWMQHEKERRVA